jgi:hypothetical protein
LPGKGGDIQGECSRNRLRFTIVKTYFSVMTTAASAPQTLEGRCYFPTSITLGS